MAEAVKVIVRCRPFNKREQGMGCKSVVNMDPSCGQCRIGPSLAEPNGDPKAFTFDGVYFMDSTAEQIYNEIVYTLVENVLEGYNGTVFAYGQTGSGKTFSMQGTNAIAAQRGIIPRTFEHLFEATAAAENVKFLIHGSYLEIYNEEVRDLLGKEIKHKLDIKEHPEKGVYVAGLSLHACHNVEECQQLMEMGFKNRSTGATLMNVDSSRSHSIFSIHIEMMVVKEDGEHIKTAKLHLVDLAGSERQAKTGATGERFKEATKINLSLSALGNVISALVDGKSKHIPYRDSKLTRLLQDSLGGNTKTLMVACISPADNNYDESLSTLRYANRAKNIKNKPKINEDPKDALLREYQEEIERLKQMLGGGAPAPNAAGPAFGRQPSIDLEGEKAKLRQEFQEQMTQLRSQYEDEQKNKSKLEQDLMRLKADYESATAKVEREAAQEQRVLAAGAPTTDHNGTTTVPGGMTAPSSSPTLNGVHPMADPAVEAAKRLELLQQQMVGGEQSNNTALREKRRRKKADAERRNQRLAEALKNVQADDPLLHVYNSTQDKLEAVTKELQKEKRHAKSLENEIQDLQSEFELDRIDYLDTIRRQDQQMKLLQQILDKVQPCIRRDSNYCNIEKIKKEAVWDEDLQKWHLAEMAVTRTQLPQAGGLFQTGGRIPIGSQQTVLSPRNVGAVGLFDEPNDNKLKQRLEQSSQDDIANSYFKPLRVDGILARNQKDKNRDVERNRSNHFPSKTAKWDALMTGVIYTNDIYERSATSSPSPAGGDTTAPRKPQRLEALGNGVSTSAPSLRQLSPKPQHHQLPGGVVNGGGGGAAVLVKRNKKPMIRPSW